jgi:hypothetical protein
MWRFIRRWFARLCHRHDWVTLREVEITTTWPPKYPEFQDPITRKDPAVFQRCYCGAERAFWLKSTERKKIDPLWFRTQCSMQLDDPIPDYITKHD